MSVLIDSGRRGAVGQPGMLFGDYLVVDYEVPAV
jgi:hypothetical protein